MYLVEDVDEVQKDFGRRRVLLHSEVALHVAIERVQQEHVAYGAPLLLLLFRYTVDWSIDRGQVKQVISNQDNQRVQQEHVAYGKPLSSSAPVDVQSRLVR